MRRPLRRSPRRSSRRSSVRSPRRSGPALPRLLRDEGGLSTAEYLIILILIGVIGILAWKTFGQAAGEKADEATASVQGLRNSGSGEVEGASIRERRPVGVQGAEGAEGADGAEGAAGADGAGGSGEGRAAAGGGGDEAGVYGAGDDEEEGGSNALLIVAVILFAFFASLPFIARMKKG
ncbi:MAG: hypothetical protein AAF447_12050 [Myxococcota bacterium]